MAEDEIPYFRRSWRMAFSTSCPLHRRLLADRCADCGAPAVLHRGAYMSCHICGLGYCDTATRPVTYESAKFGWGLIKKSEGAITSFDAATSVHPIIYFETIRQLVKVLLSSRRGSELRDETARQFHVYSNISLHDGVEGAFEMLEPTQRHMILELAGILMSNWPSNLVRCCSLSRNWRAWLLLEMKPIRYPLWDVADRYLRASNSSRTKNT